MRKTAQRAYRVTQTRLIKTTPLVGLRPLGLHGQPAIDSYRQLAAVLETRLGPDHAALFARPERRRDGGIDWFTDRPVVFWLRMSLFFGVIIFLALLWAAGTWLSGA